MPCRSHDNPQNYVDVLISVIEIDLFKLPILRKKMVLSHEKLGIYMGSLSIIEMLRMGIYTDSLQMGIPVYTNMVQMGTYTDMVKIGIRTWTRYR